MARRNRNLTNLGVVAVVLLLLWACVFSPDRFPAPVVVSCGGSASNLSVNVGVGVLMVLPDGSLWGWGQPGGMYTSKRMSVPQRIGTDTNWLRAVACNNHCLALKTDGTIWELGGAVNPLLGLQQVDPGRDWVAIAGGDVHAIALKRDGSLWTWGDGKITPLGNGIRGRFTKPIPVAEGHRWKAVSAMGSRTFAIREDGTMWTWGGNMGIVAPAVPTPTQLCSDTNWSQLEGSRATWAYTSDGEVWDVSLAPGPAMNPSTPNSAARASAVCRIIASNCAPGRIASENAKILQLHPDGTLWEMKFWPSPSGKWRQVGGRKDWQQISGCGTVVGLTSDGTLWTWGSNQGEEPRPDFESRLVLAQAAIQRIVGTPPGSVSTVSYARQQKKPRPLLRLEATNTNSGGRP